MYQVEIYENISVSLFEYKRFYEEIHEQFEILIKTCDCYLNCAIKDNLSNIKLRLENYLNIMEKNHKMYIDPINSSKYEQADFKPTCKSIRDFVENNASEIFQEIENYHKKISYSNLSYHYNAEFNRYKALLVKFYKFKDYAEDDYEVSNIKSIMKEYIEAKQKTYNSIIDPKFEKLFKNNNFTNAILELYEKNNWFMNQYFKLNRSYIHNHQFH